MSAPSEAQSKLLRKFDYDPSKLDFESASDLIDEIAEAGWKRPDGKEVAQNDGDGLCTKKQAACLEKHGYETEDVTFQEASDLIQQLAENDWEPLSE